MTIAYQLMDARTLKNQFDERKQDWLGQKFGLWWLERFDVILAEPSFLLFTQEDKWILCLQGGKRRPQQSITVVATQAGRLQECALVHYTIKTVRCPDAYVYVTVVPPSAYRIFLE